jgi:hypothetical protein
MDTFANTLFFIKTTLRHSVLYDRIKKERFTPIELVLQIFTHNHS